jgi:hypothetical protein
MKLNAVITHNAEENTVTLGIAVNEHIATSKGTIYVVGIQQVCYPAEGHTGDLGVEWTMTGATNKQLEEVLYALYYGKEFNEHLQNILRCAGFSDAAAADVCGSEQGMQDIGRASYDALTLGREICEAAGVEFNEQ